MAVIHRISKDNKEILVRIVSHICLILYDGFDINVYKWSKSLLSLYRVFDVIAYALYALT